MKYQSIIMEMQDGMRKKDVFKFLHGVLTYLNVTGETPSEQLIELLDNEKSEEDKYKIMLEEFTKVHNEIKKDNIFIINRNILEC